MSLKQDIEILKERIEYTKKSLDHHKEKLKVLLDIEEISIPDLYKELSKITSLNTFASNHVQLSIQRGEYEHILGGDGRSQPWSEKRKGTICDVTVSFYLEESYSKIITDYINSLGKVDKININN